MKYDVEYQCGCKASGPEPLPDYCPQHDPKRGTLWHAIYDDMLHVMAAGRPTGSTELLANELRALIGKPEWPAEGKPAVTSGDQK